jgi:putative membrane protein
MKKMLNSTIALLLGGFLMAGITTFAQSDSKDSLSSADKHFISEAAEGGLAEVELGRLAENKASNPKVKDFGQKMVEDHSKANSELKHTAQKLGVSVPDHISATQLAEKTKLSAYSGTHFDRSYMDAMLKDHRDDIAAFKREAADGENAEIKSFASKTLPTLEEHLRLAEKTEREVGSQSPSSTR